MKDNYNRYRVFAEKSVRYFKGIIGRYNSGSSMQLGLKVSEQWLSLIDEPFPDPQVIKEFLYVLNQNKEEGSGWYELYLQASAWVETLQLVTSDQSEDAGLG